MEQYQKQLYRAEEDRRQALATSEALTALWQKKFEKAQNENYELKQELLSAQDRISHLQECLARSSWCTHTHTHTHTLVSAWKIVNRGNGN